MKSEAKLGYFTPEWNRTKLSCFSFHCPWGNCSPMDSYHPPVYLRNIDGIFIIKTNGKKYLEKFYQDFNTFHPFIKLWNTPVKICSGYITTSLCPKPINHNSYLQATSFYTKNITRSIVYSSGFQLFFIFGPLKTLKLDTQTPLEILNGCTPLHCKCCYSRTFD